MKKQENVIKTRRKTTEDFIRESKIVHGEKFDYSLVDYKTAKTKIKIICSRGHIFDKIPNDHLRGSGCPHCSGWGKFKNDSNLFIEQSKLIHGDVYDYSELVYLGMDINVNIICKEHGLFSQNPSTHISKKAGCPKCGVINHTQKRTSSKEQFIECSNLIHQNLYKYDNFLFIDYKTKSIISCEKHGDFLMAPKTHIHQKQGCPKCRVPKGEREIENYLITKNIKYIPQHKFEDCKYKRKLSFDFYLPQRNICIEFDGKQHFEPHYIFGENKFKEGKIRDDIKNQYCLNNNIKLIRIKYLDIDKIYSILNINLK